MSSDFVSTYHVTYFYYLMTFQYIRKSTRFTTNNQVFSSCTKSYPTMLRMFDTKYKIMLSTSMMMPPKYYVFVIRITKDNAFLSSWFISLFKLIIAHYYQSLLSYQSHLYYMLLVFQQFIPDKSHQSVFFSIPLFQSNRLDLMSYIRHLNFACYGNRFLLLYF